MGQSISWPCHVIIQKRQLIQHFEYSEGVEAAMKWSSFCRHFQVHFPHWKYIYFDLNVIEVCFQVTN